MKIGYARVSTADQNLDSQVDELKEDGCEKIFTDIVSGAKSERPGLAALKAHIRSSDIVVVVRLDRLGRNLKDLVALVEEFEQQDVQFISLHEKIETTSSSGRLIFHLFTALAEFERNLIRERSLAGLKAARARGRAGGARFKLNKQEVKMLKALYHSKKVPVSEIADQFNICRKTVYNYL